MSRRNSTPADPQTRILTLLAGEAARVACRGEYTLGTYVGYIDAWEGEDRGGAELSAR